MNDELTFTATANDFEVRSQVVNHGVKDAKGREIGSYAAIIDQAKYSAWWLASGPDRGWGGRRDGFEVQIYATRDGKDFGPGFRKGTMYDTLEQAKAGAAKKLAQKTWKLSK